MAERCCVGARTELEGAVGSRLSREPHLQRVAASAGGDGPPGRSPSRRSNRVRAGEPTRCARPGAIVRRHGSRAGSGHRNVAVAIASSVPVVTIALEECDRRAPARLKGTTLLSLGEGESRQRPPGIGILTSAFAESRRAPRPAAAAYADPDDGRVLAVDSERQDRCGGVAKACVGQVCAEARIRGKHATRGRRPRPLLPRESIGDRLGSGDSVLAPEDAAQNPKSGERPRVNGSRRSTRPREAA